MPTCANFFSVKSNKKILVCIHNTCSINPYIGDSIMFCLNQADTMPADALLHLSPRSSVEIIMTVMLRSSLHDDIIKWKHFPHYWPFVWGIHWSPVNSPAQRPVKRSFDVFFDLRLNKWLSKQSWCRWFETPLCSLWCHCNVSFMNIQHIHVKEWYEIGALTDSAHELPSIYVHDFSTSNSLKMPWIN